MGNRSAPGRRQGPSPGSLAAPLAAIFAMLWIAIQGLAPAAARAQPLPEALTATETARVVEVIDGDTVLLDDDREVRLVGLQAPKLSLGRPHVTDWPLAPEAQAALAGLVLNREVGLAFGGRPTDRHGRALAHLVLSDGTWVQGWMLARGWARVYSFADNRTAVGDMLALETEARAAGRGMWAHPGYRVLHAEDAEGAPDGFPAGTFQLVEGRVREVASVGRLVFVNFGPDYRRDFTLVLEGPVRSVFEESGVDPAAWAGQRIRARGWIYQHNGPAIELSHPEQVEVMGP